MLAKNVHGTMYTVHGRDRTKVSLIEWVKMVKAPLLVKDVVSKETYEENNDNDETRREPRIF